MTSAFTADGSQGKDGDAATSSDFSPQTSLLSDLCSFWGSLIPARQRGMISICPADRLGLVSLCRTGSAPTPVHPASRGLMTWKDWRSLHIWAAPPERPCDVFGNQQMHLFASVCVCVVPNAYLGSSLGRPPGPGSPGASGPVVFAAR